jgi:4-hydroxybenzoate polyprenyltransferase
MATSTPVGLLKASHPAPAAAVTALTALLAIAAGHDFVTGLLVTAAVGAGQLSIGWSNDLIDAARDRKVGRLDKPIARGEISAGLVRRAVAVALILCVVLSLACGLAAAVVNLVLGVGSGWAYNLYFKRTLWSALPYAVCFGTLPAVVTLALPVPELPAPWTFAAGALLGVGAHLLNALPDLADDASTGVHALPHQLGERRVRVLAPLVLLVASCVVVFGPGTPDSPAPWVALGACVVLAVVSVTSRGRTPFLAAIGIALVDVVSLGVRS